MTGYGKESISFEGKTIHIEVKSLNSKSLDLYTKIPSLYREKEVIIRQIISEKLNRGKIDLAITIENSGTQKGIEINKDLVKNYYQELKALDEIIGVQANDYHSLLIKLPNIFIESNEILSEKETEALELLLSKACDKLIEFRNQEGEALRKEFIERIETIRSLLKAVEPFEKTRIETVKERIRKNLEELALSQVDENRFQQELIYYVEKFDVSEEKMRLTNHLDYFLETMNTEFAGKKLGFITQEIGREINTLGSKANHAEIQKIVVEMKDNLEKIKEQVLNTL